MLLQCVQSDDDDGLHVARLVTAERPTLNLLQQCLWQACRRGKPSTATILIEQGAYVMYQNKYLRTLLMVAAHHGFGSDQMRLRTAQLLIQRGADLTVRDYEGKTALHYAVMYDRQSLAVWLAGLCALDVVSDAFMVAVTAGNVCMARKMLMCGANMNYAAANGIQVAVIATCRQDCEMLSFLTYNGANINAAASTGATALHFAARVSIAVLALVLQRGGDVHAETNQCNTALHYAVDAGRIDNVRLLLQYQSDPNAENERGETPLFLACRKRQDVDLILALLQSGADPNRCDDALSFPLNQLVIQPTFCDFRAVDLLQRYGARLNPLKGAHPLALLASMDANVPYELVVGMILRGARLKASRWFNYINYPPTLLKLAVWALSNKRAAVAYYYTFVFGEEKGIRPVPVPRRLTGAYGLYPIRRRLAAYLVQPKSDVRYMIQELVDQF